MSFPRPRSCSRSRLGGGAETPGLPAGHPPSFLSGAGSATTSWLSACAGSGACAISWCSSGRARGGADLHSSRKAGTTFHYHREQSVYVNPFYEEDFGPIFFKVCSCAALEPEALLEWAGVGPREKPGVAFGTLDNAFSRPSKVAADLRPPGAGSDRPALPKWRERLPQPLKPRDREAGHDCGNGRSGRWRSAGGPSQPAPPGQEL